MVLFNSSEQLLSRTRSIEQWIVDVRRRLHQCPELLYDLPETSSIVCETLTDLGIDFQGGIAESGVVATIGKGMKPSIMLRADMDALPIQELSDVSFKSKNDGKMHACGHDCHTAMLLGAARILKEQEASLPGIVKLCFQPAEEGGAGGKRMCDAGVMDNPKVSKVFGIHMWPSLPTGLITSRPGAFLAATNAFEIRVKGKGGHAAMPHLGSDCIVAAAKIITSLQTIVSREQNPTEAAVVSFTAVSSASSYNVIPSEVTIQGTIRSLSSSKKDQLKQRVAEAAIALARIDRCEAEFISIGEDYPATCNDPELWSIVGSAASRLLGKENVILCDPILGGEDFAYYGEFAPTCFVAVGCRNEAEGCIHSLHHPSFRPDEKALPIGTALHLMFVSEHFAGI